MVNNTLFIGSTSGRFYALDAQTLLPIWQYPPATQPPLLGTCAGWGRYGIQSSASYFVAANGTGVVVFGANNPAAETGLGSATLFALNASNGSVIWISDVVAHLTGCQASVTTEYHERIAYSTPLISNGTAYVGIHDASDDPIQRGRVAAVDVNTGHLVPGFSYASTSPGFRGGGVWNTLAADANGELYFTTGNTRCDNAGCQSAPPINYGLSMLRVDPLTGAVAWQFQPVPYDLDEDPDWSAGVAIINASCGTIATSVQKDGWAYAVNVNSGNCQWQFPPTAPAGSGCKFPSGGPNDHAGDDYKRPAAIWGDVVAIHTGGEALVHDGVNAGYTRLHALNACAANESTRVRWLFDVPNATPASGYSFGTPTVTGGIFYVSTDQGHLLAIADPSIVPATQFRCSNIDFTVAQCTQAGYAVVPVPVILANVTLDGSSAAGLRSEVAIANGNLYVGTEGGHVYRITTP